MGRLVSYLLWHQKFKLQFCHPTPWVKFSQLVAKVQITFTVRLMNTVARKLIELAEWNTLSVKIEETEISFDAVSLKIAPDIEEVNPHYYEFQWKDVPENEPYAVLVFEMVTSCPGECKPFFENARTQLQGDGYSKNFGDWLVHSKKESSFNYLTFRLRENVQ